MPDGATALIATSSESLSRSLAVLLKASGHIATVLWIQDARTLLRTLRDESSRIIFFDADWLDGEKIYWLPLPILHSCVLAHTRRQTERARAAGAAAILPEDFSTETLFQALQTLLGS